MRTSDEALFEGVIADQVPDGSDALRAMFDVVAGLAMLVWAIVLLFVPARRRARKHRA